MRKALFVALSLLLVTMAGAVTAQGAVSANAGASQTVTVGQTVTLDATGSSGEIVDYWWNFGDGSTGRGATTTHTYTSAGTYTVTLTVVGADATDSATTTVTVQTADSVAPNITHTPTSSGTANSALTITADVNDSGGGTVDTVTLFYKRASESSFVNSTSMAVASGSPSYRYTGQIPSTVTSGSAVHYYVRAEDTATPANVGKWPANAPTGFVTVALTDTQAPTIEVNATTLPNPVTSGQAVNVRVNISDNVAVNATTVKFYWRYTTTGSTFSNSRTMDLLSGDATSGVYNVSFTVQSGVTDLQYYVEANDTAASPNTARSPSTAPGSPSTVGVVSTSSPTISHTPPSSATAGTALSLQATVTPTTGREIKYVGLSYRNASSSDSWNETEMTNTSSATSVYTATIPAGNVSDRGIEYVINVTDTSGDIRRYPASGRSSPQVVKTPPAQVTGLAANDGSTGIELSWTALTSTGTSSVAKYTVYRRSSGGTTWSALAEPTSSSYTDTSATKGKLYEYRVSAVDLFDAEGPASETVSEGLAPDAPASLALSPSASGALTATWSAVTGATSYTVEADTGSGFASLATPASALATLTGLANGASVSVRVKATTPAGESDYSSTATETPIGAPAAPAGVTVTRTASGQATVAWTALESTTPIPVTGYAIRRSTSPTSGFSTLATVTGASTTSYVDTSATEGTKFYYKVAGRNALGTSASQSDAVSTAFGVTLAAPTLSVSTGPGQISLSWTSVGSAARYLVESSSDGSTWTLEENTTSRSHTLTGLAAGATLQVRVLAQNAQFENGTASAAESATVPGGGGGDARTPVLTLTAPSDGASVAGLVKIQGTALNTTLAHVVVTIDAENGVAATGATEWSLDWDTTKVTDGTHRIHVRATSTGGAISSTSIDVIVDNTPPVVTFAAEEGAVLAAGRSSVDFTATDAHAVTAALAVDGEDVPVTALDGNAFTAADVVLSPGEHTLVATVTDSLGNAASATLTVTAEASDDDGESPVLQVTAGPEEGAVIGESPTFTVTFTDETGVDALTLKVLVNGEDVTASAEVAEGAVTHTVDAVGRVTFTVSVADVFGRTGSVTRSFTVDQEGPGIEFVPPSGATLTAGLSAVLAAAFSDAAGVDPETVRVLVNGEDVTSRVEVTAAGVNHATPVLDAALGTYTLRVEASDVLGNPASAEASYVIQALADEDEEEPAPEDEEDPTGSEAETETDPDAPASTGTPGFGAAFAATGLLGAAYAFGRRRRA